MAPSSDITKFQSILQKSRHIIAIAGAGLSAASGKSDKLGIPTFRGSDGLWLNYTLSDLATPRAFRKNPSKVWQFYHYRREIAGKALPNPAHIALALFSQPDQRKEIAPDAEFTLITQNVDGLSVLCSQMLFPSTDPPIIEMHGRLFETLCTQCGDRMPNRDSPICPALAGTEELVKSHAKERQIPLEDLPRCQKCRGLLRPGVVWFEESILRDEEISELVDQADVALVIGTSSRVAPANLFAHSVAERKGTVAVFNTEPQGIGSAHFYFPGPCEQTLPRVLLGKEPDKMNDILQQD